MEENNCDLYPEFAVVCSFLRHFGQLIDFQLDIEDLKSSLENQEKVDDSLKMLHFQLLRRTWCELLPVQWQLKLSRYARSLYSQKTADEIKTNGYHKIKLFVKLELLSALLHDLFEYDIKFQKSVESMSTKQLRQPPVGRDMKGNIYWQFNDLKGNFRVLRTRPFDMQELQTICYNKDELSGLISHLSEFKNQLIKGKPLSLSADSLVHLYPARSDSNTIRMDHNNEMKAISAYFIKRNIKIVCAKAARKEVNEEWNGEIHYKPCIRCDESDHPETTLMCEICDDCYHTTCCLPPLSALPDSEWYCPTCEHDMLLINLRSLRSGIISVLQLEREKEKERKRAAMELDETRGVLDELDQSAVSRRSGRLLRPRTTTISFSEKITGLKSTRRSKRLNNSCSK